MHRYLRIMWILALGVIIGNACTQTRTVGEPEKFTGQTRTALLTSNPFSTLAELLVTRATTLLVSSS